MPYIVKIISSSNTEIINASSEDEVNLLVKNKFNEIINKRGLNYFEYHVNTNKDLYTINYSCIGANSTYTITIKIQNN